MAGVVRVGLNSLSTMTTEENKYLTTYFAGVNEYIMMTNFYLKLLKLSKLFQ